MNFTKISDRQKWNNGLFVIFSRLFSERLMKLSVETNIVYIYIDIPMIIALR